MILLQIKMGTTTERVRDNLIKEQNKILYESMGTKPDLNL